MLDWMPEQAEGKGKEGGRTGRGRGKADREWKKAAFGKIIDFNRFVSSITAGWYSVLSRCSPLSMRDS
jgi:hypothetical protein